MYLIVNTEDNIYHYQHSGTIFTVNIEKAEEYFLFEDAEKWAKRYSFTKGPYGASITRKLKVVRKDILLRKEKLKKLKDVK